MPGQPGVSYGLWGIMRKQLSIVLVEGDHVPRELSALLVGMGVWVKSTWSTGLGAALIQTNPHLVVCGDPSQLPLLKRAISETHPGTPLLLIADWDLDRAGRAISSGLVEDLIPESLPAADIARRLETLATRRASQAPSRTTLTPPTRAGIHPLLPVGAGRDDRTPESRRDPPAPSRRPPPPPVRVMSHAPSWAPPRVPGSTMRPSALPTGGTAAGSVPPGSIPPGPSNGPPGSVRPARLAPAPAALPQSLPPRPPTRGYPGALPTYSRPAAAAARDSFPQRSQSAPPRSVAPYSISPDSAPPIQMVTTTTTVRRARKRSSGPGFTLGAALGVAASAAAFVGVIEFERDLRSLASLSASRVEQLVGTSGTKLPSWLLDLTKRAKADSSSPAALGVSAPPPAPAAPAATGAAPLELSDLGAIETDSSLGMSQADAVLLFQMEDQRLPSCDQLLAGWEPPLPMIEEDRPKHGAAHRRKAQDRLVAGEPEKALGDLCKSARIDPAGPGTESLASVYLSLRSLEQAEAWIRRYLADNPRSDSARELLGDIQNQQGRVSMAKTLWLDVLGVESDATGLMREVAKHWVSDATSAMAARDLAQAERKLRRALTLDPTSPSAALLLSKVLERQDETAASLAWSKRARELAR